jgi:hypothetical protein
MKIGIPKIKLQKSSKIKKPSIQKTKKITMPGVRFGPPPKKGPSSQGMKWVDIFLDKTKINSIYLLKITEIYDSTNIR